MAVLETSLPVRRFRFSALDGSDEQPKAREPETEKPAQEPQSAQAQAGPLPLPLSLPAITEKDLQTARSDAQAQGYRDGYAAAQDKFNKEGAAREEAVRNLLEVIANRITIAAESHVSRMREREALMGRLVMAAARKVAGEALRREPYAGVENLLHECMGLIAGAPKITIIVSSALAPGLRQRIDDIKAFLQSFDGELTVEEDAALMDQDCRVEWNKGYGERNTEELWSALEAIVMKTNVNS